MEKIEKIRIAVANYMNSEGCSCCRLIDEHNKNEEILAKLLNIPKYDDGSGYDFSQFANKKFKF